MRVLVAASVLKKGVFRSRVIGKKGSRTKAGGEVLIESATDKEGTS